MTVHLILRNYWSLAGPDPEHIPLHLDFWGA